MTALPRRRRTAGPDAPRVLLLHGLGGRPGAWDRLVDALPERLDVFDVELPWHGMAGSEWSHHADPVRILAEAVEGFDTLIAHSFSANLLTEAFATGRIRPRPVVLVSPFYRARADEFDWATITYYLNDFHRTFTEALRVGETSRFPAAHRDWMALRLRDQVGPYGWMRWFETYLRSPFLDLAQVDSPVLVVTGAEDIAARPADGAALANSLPHGRFVLLDHCGHFPMLERPEALARLAGDFLTAPISQAAQPSLELT